MIVYCISSASRLGIAPKVMTQRTCIIVDNIARLQPRLKGTGWLARLGIGGVDTAMDLVGEYRLVLKSDLVLTISKGHRLELPSLEIGSSEGFCWELLPVSDRKGEGSDTGLGEHQLVLSGSIGVLMTSQGRSSRDVRSQSRLRLDCVDGWTS